MRWYREVFVVLVDKINIILITKKPTALNCRLNFVEIICLVEAQHQTDVADDKGHNPGYSKLIADKGKGASCRIDFASDGCQSCYAGRIQQAED